MWVRHLFVFAILNPSIIKIVCQKGERGQKVERDTVTEERVDRNK